MPVNRSRTGGIQTDNNRTVPIHATTESFSLFINTDLIEDKEYEEFVTIQHGQERNGHNGFESGGVAEEGAEMIEYLHSQLNSPPPSIVSIGLAIDTHNEFERSSFPSLMTPIDIHLPFIFETYSVQDDGEDAEEVAEENELEEAEEHDQNEEDPANEFYSHQIQLNENGENEEVTTDSEGGIQDWEDYNTEQLTTNLIKHYIDCKTYTPLLSLFPSNFMRIDPHPQMSPFVASTYSKCFKDKIQDLYHDLCDKNGQKKSASDIECYLQLFQSHLQGVYTNVEGETEESRTNQRMRHLFTLLASNSTDSPFHVSNDIFQFPILAIETEHMKRAKKIFEMELELIQMDLTSLETIVDKLDTISLIGR